MVSAGSLEVMRAETQKDAKRHVHEGLDGFGVLSQHDLLVLCLRIFSGPWRWQQRVEELKSCWTYHTRSTYLYLLSLYSS